MDTILKFIFREKLFTCEVCIDCSEDPSFVFVLLADEELVSEFGDEITIKTDFISRLARRDDLDNLVLLRQAIFDSLKFHPMFLQAKAKKLMRSKRSFA
jgi:hypothetical protein